jgi:hypothetical protein
MRASDYAGRDDVPPQTDRESDRTSSDITEEEEGRILSKIEEAVGPLMPRTSSASRQPPA